MLNSSMLLSSSSIAADSLIQEQWCFYVARLVKSWWLCACEQVPLTTSTCSVAVAGQLNSVHPSRL